MGRPIIERKEQDGRGQANSDINDANGLEPTPILPPTRRMHASLRVTPRQSQILVLLGMGFSCKEIGRKLGISGRTVETHMLDFYRNNGLRTRSQAITLWERSGPAQRFLD